MKNKRKNLLISLQFFASEDISANVSSEIGDASPSIETPPVTASAECAENGNQLEEEFEKLIKGGKYEDAFKKRTQGIIDKRFKSYKSLEESTAKQKPIFDFLSEKYGVDSSDTELLLKKMQSEKTDAREKADFNAGHLNANEKSMLIHEKATALSKKWAAEGEQLKKIFPSFDFAAELKNPAFKSLLKSGMPVRKAYTAAHSDELIRNAVSGTAKRVAEQTFKSIRAQGSRVAENGLHNGAGIVKKTDVSSLTGSEIRSILKQVENGSKIRF